MRISMEELQALFYKWFLCFETRNVNQIRLHSKNLLASYQIETKSSLFKIFYPLVRYGLIEFCGDGIYKTCNPVLLLYPDNKVIGINLTLKQKEKLKSCSKEFRSDHFDIIRCEASQIELKDFSQEFDIPLLKPDIVEYLSNFPKLKNCISTINGFEQFSSSIFNEKFDIKSRKWIKDHDNNCGLFRNYENAQKFYFVDGELTYSLPSNNHNPEARPIIESYIYCKNYSFKYDLLKKELNVGYINLPILIERVLRLSSLFETTEYTKEYNNQIYHNISKNVISQLNRIFNIKTVIT